MNGIWLWWQRLCDRWQWFYFTSWVGATKLGHVDLITYGSFAVPSFRIMSRINELMLLFSIPRALKVDHHCYWRRNPRMEGRAAFKKCQVYLIYRIQRHHQVCNTSLAEYLEFKNRPPLCVKGAEYSHLVDFSGSIVCTKMGNSNASLPNYKCVNK